MSVCVTFISVSSLHHILSLDWSKRYLQQGSKHLWKLGRQTDILTDNSFWVITPCNSGRAWHFRGTYCLLQDWRVNQVKSQQKQGFLVPKIEAVCCSEIPGCVSVMWCYSPDNCTPQSHSCENFRSNKIFVCQENVIQYFLAPSCVSYLRLAREINVFMLSYSMSYTFAA
jgi:hypothetical protein